MGKMLKAKIKNALLDTREQLTVVKDLYDDFKARRVAYKKYNNRIDFIYDVYEPYNSWEYRNPGEAEKIARRSLDYDLNKIKTERKEIREKRLEALEKQKSENIKNATEVEFEKPSKVEAVQIEETPSIADVEKEKTE